MPGFNLFDPDASSLSQLNLQNNLNINGTDAYHDPGRTSTSHPRQDEVSSTSTFHPFLPHVLEDVHFSEPSLLVTPLVECQRSQVTHALSLEDLTR